MPPRTRRRPVRLVAVPLPWDAAEDIGDFVVEDPSAGAYDSADASWDDEPHPSSSPASPPPLLSSSSEDDMPVPAFSPTRQPVREAARVAAVNIDHSSREQQMTAIIVQALEGQEGESIRRRLAVLRDTLDVAIKVRTKDADTCVMRGVQAHAFLAAYYDSGVMLSAQIIAAAKTMFDASKMFRPRYAESIVEALSNYSIPFEFPIDDLPAGVISRNFVGTGDDSPRALFWRSDSLYVCRVRLVHMSVGKDACDELEAQRLVQSAPADDGPTRKRSRAEEEASDAEELVPGMPRCSVCLSEIPSFMFEDCRHVCVCETCVERMRGEPCPVCRKDSPLARVLFS